MQNWVLLILILNARKRAIPAFKIKISKTQGHSAY